MRISQSDLAGYSIYTLAAGEDEVVVSSFGAQIHSWVKSGVPIVFENRERAVNDGKTAYRGGAPICFPYFGPGKLLAGGWPLQPMHGRARISLWEQKVEDSVDELVLATVQPAGEGYGPTEFSCELRFLLSDGLRLRATVRNIGGLEAPFQLAVHTYWATSEPAGAVVKGLGNRYLDNLLGLSEQSEGDSFLPHSTPVDRVYLDAESSQELVTESYRLGISTQGCSGAVLWNPGIHHDLKDVGSPDFICLESGLIFPGKTLGQGEQHTLEIEYRAHV